MIIAALIILGLSFGSFVNALVWRLHSQTKARSQKRKNEFSISKGRSMCPHCKHQLAAKDLVPVVSWLRLSGKCRYCHKPISGQYPLVELSTACLFVISYIFWPFQLTGGEWLQFAVWLVCLVGFMALVIYDIRYMLLPNKIIFPLTGIAIFGTLAQALLLSSVDPLKSASLGLLIGGGLFYILFQVSDGRWIGGGDVKLGFLLGILVGGPELALLMLFIASLLGTMFSLPLMATGRMTPKMRIPFGPFLIIGAIAAKLFGEQLVSLYTNNFL